MEVISIRTPQPLHNKQRFHIKKYPVSGFLCNPPKFSNDQQNAIYFYTTTILTGILYEILIGNQEFIEIFPIPKKNRRAATISTVIIAIIVSYYYHFPGEAYFTRRGIRQMSSLITSYGILSPLAVIFLIFKYRIPPLPFPCRLSKLQPGTSSDFGPELFLVWFSQIISSLFALL